MKVLRRCLTVPLSRDAAWELFTATGERRWAPGWDPRFPEGDDDRTPGTVFVTVHGTQETTWVVVTSQPGERIAYARVSSEGTAGTVEVICDAAGPEKTEVTVTYRLTALTSAGQHHLARFSDDFSVRSTAGKPPSWLPSPEARQVG
jgi:hypothetical protein